jgi:hypothetical protein
VIARVSRFQLVIVPIYESVGVVKQKGQTPHLRDGKGCQGCPQGVHLDRTFLIFSGGIELTDRKQGEYFFWKVEEDKL